MKYDISKMFWAFCGVVFADGDGSGGDGDGDGSGDGSGDGAGDNTVNGVEYSRDAENNYCLNDIPVLGADQVPIYNRSREADKKSAKAHAKELKALEAKHAADMEAFKGSGSKPAADPNAEDSKTGLLNWQADGLESRTLSKVEQRLSDMEIEGANDKANQNIELQMIKLKNNSDFDVIFKNEKYSAELQEQLDGLSLQGALTKGIVSKVADAIIGSHIKDIKKQVAEEATRKANEGREIVEEISLGGSSGASSGKTVKVTAEMREYAKSTGLPIKLAVPSYLKREKIRAKKQ